MIGRQCKLFDKMSQLSISPFITRFILSVITG